MKPRTRKAWFTVTDSQGRPWLASWEPQVEMFILSTSNGRRIQRTEFAMTGQELAACVLAEGVLVSPPIQTEMPMP